MDKTTLMVLVCVQLCAPGIIFIIGMMMHVISLKQAVLWMVLVLGAFVMLIFLGGIHPADRFILGMFVSPVLPLMIFLLGWEKKRAITGSLPQRKSS